jgi:hypothetical protein
VPLGHHGSRYGFDTKLAYLDLPPWPTELGQAFEDHQSMQLKFNGDL